MQACSMRARDSVATALEHSTVVSMPRYESILVDTAVSTPYRYRLRIDFLDRMRSLGSVSQSLRVLG
eukprot:5966565-Prymnesium_polylepis.2